MFSPQKEDMIDYISGTLIEKSPSYAVVDCGGIGFYIYISSHTFETLPEPGSRVKIFVDFSIKDSGAEIYGFHNELEREIFKQITTVPGIGNKLALSILSNLSIGEFVSAIRSSALEPFSKVPSLGKKRAERLINELKEKVDRFKIIGYEIDYSVLNDALSAMVSLGYKRSESKAVLENILKSEPNLSLEEILRKALPIISRK